MVSLESAVDFAKAFVGKPRPFRLRRMVVMASNGTGWFWHCLARETQRIGHLYSPGAERGPWPWFCYALDNGAFSLWDPKTNTFDEALWQSVGVQAWRELLSWVRDKQQKPLWAIVPDCPGNWQETIIKWSIYAAEMQAEGIPLAVAVQDGASVEDVKGLTPQPDVICVGGSDEFKWETAEEWLRSFPRVHVLRCNAPEKLYWLESLGCESCDGTGWNRGDLKQTSGLERWARGTANTHKHELWPHVCKSKPKKKGTRRNPIA